jgi:hypothetical protein
MVLYQPIYPIKVLGKLALATLPITLLSHYIVVNERYSTNCEPMSSAFLVSARVSKLGSSLWVLLLDRSFSESIPCLTLTS